MTEAIKIRRNSFFSLISSTVRLLVNFLVFWIIARKYGPVSFGQFTVAHTLATLWMFFADFGFDILLTTEIARDRSQARRHFQQYFSLKVLFSLAALFGMWLIAFFNDLGYESRILIMIFSIFMICNALTNFISAFYKGFERLEYETKVTFYSNIGLLILVLFLIYLNASVVSISIAFALSRIAGFVIGIYYSFKVLPEISYKLFFKNIKIVRKKVLIFGFHLLFNNLYFQIDTVFLAYWKGDYDAGIYQSVFKLILLPLILPDILTNVLTPTLSRLNVQNQLQWKKIGRLTNKLLFFFGIPISMILFVYPEQIVELLYGLGRYRDAVIVLRILSVMLFIRFSFETFSLILTTSDRQHIRMLVVIAATCINVALNYFLIPRYGAAGSAVVSLICNSFVGITYYLVSMLIFKDWYPGYKAMGLFVISAIIGVAYWNCRTITMFVGIPVLLILFSLIAYYFYFSNEEKKVLLSSEYGFSLFKK